MKRFSALVATLLLATLVLRGFEASYHFEEKDASILDSGSGAYHGVYHPSADKDNDNPETTDPRRYRKEGFQGNALSFFASYRSFATIPCPWMKEGLERFYLSLQFNPGPNSIQYLIGNKTDSSKSGFSLMLWGNQWRLGFGDGNESATLRIPVKSRAAGWHHLALAFEKGNVTFQEDGRITCQEKIPVQKILSTESSLTLGNYCGRKNAYCAEGAFDELMLSDSPEGLQKAMKAFQARKPSLKATCLPVDGGEKLYGNRKTLHTFREAPVGVTFFLYFEESQAPELILNVPDGVRLAEAFNSNHNTPDLLFPITEPRKGEYHIGGLRPDSLPREQITCMLEVPENFTEGEVFWSANDQAKPQHKDHFLLKALPLPPPLPEGKFYAMSYTNHDIAFFHPEIFRRTAGLFARTGLIGKGRYYERLPRRAALDEILLKDFGFQLFEISLWGGPQGGVEGAEVPRAKNAEGKDQKHACLRTLARDPRTIELYARQVKKSALTKGTVAAILDFEPWGRPRRECFCKNCVEEFRRRQNLPEGLTPDEIRKNHFTAWSHFWVDTSAMFMKMMADAFRKAGPGIPVWDYTYVFPYDSPKDLDYKFGDIPKDPRKNEEFLQGSLLSLYHINGRAAFDEVRLSRRHLRKEISSIHLISRHDMVCGHYTAPEEVLSPAQIYQKAVMDGAFGHPWFGIYPGHWIDGSMHIAINHAIRDVRLHENFYLNGKDITDATPIRAEGAKKDSAYLVHSLNGKSLATLFNFTSKPLKFTFPAFGEVTVEPDGVRFQDF